MMDLWYQTLSLLPFEWAGPQGMLFMKHALLAILLLLPVLAVMGTLVVEHRMSFFSDALGHGAFTGVAAGALAGLLHLQFASIGFAIVFAILLVFVQRRSGLPKDSVLGALASFFVALGLFLATWGGQDTTLLTRYLLGDLLSVTPQDLGLAFFIDVHALIAFAWGYNRWILQGSAPGISASRAFHPLWTELSLAILIAVLVSMSLQWLGLLTVNACILLPAAASRLVARNLRSHLLWAISMALVAGIVGLMASWYAGTIAGASIVLVLSGFFFVSLLLRRK